MAFSINEIQWHMPVFLIGLLTSVSIVSCSSHAERKLHPENVWHSLVVQNTTTTSTLSTPKQLDTKKTDFQTGYDNVGVNRLKSQQELMGDINCIGFIEIETFQEFARFTMDFSSPDLDSSLGKTVLPNMMTGTDSLKKSHIIFNAYTEQSIRRNSNMTYTKSDATDGNPVNGTSGIYTAKRPGFYGFIFHALTTDPKNVLPIVELRVNGITAATAAPFNGGTYKALMLIAGAKLNQNDCISVFVVGRPLFENVNRRSKNRASFAGTLLI